MKDKDDVSFILEPLNDEQRSAVTGESQNILVLAGAGSGKTRVLTHRVAWLVRGLRVAPWSVMAVSFTNKSAREMRERIGDLLGDAADGVWAGTFHSIAYRILNRHRERAGLPPNFQVLDAADQLRLVKRAKEEIGLSEDKIPAKGARSFINGCKDQCLRPDDVDVGKERYFIDRVKIYRTYEERRRANNAVDFGDLLLCCWEMWRDDEELLERYRERFAHVLIDEFQDTNRMQFEWLKILVGDRTAVMAVGDDDQAIYGWRGAEVRNILDFDKTFADTETIRLERNYRSSGMILGAANAVIANNSNRLGKNLWTEQGPGEPLYLYAAYNETDEARFVVERAVRWAERDGCSYSDIGVLYRSNVQSRVLEQELKRQQVPYRVYGGQRFYERAEIKDALAWLSLIQTSDDNLAFARAAATPRRGLGAGTMEKLSAMARDKGVSIWRVAEEATADAEKNSRAVVALRGFMDLLRGFRKAAEKKTLPKLVDHVLQESGLLEHYDKHKEGEIAQMRVENLQELVSACDEFVSRPNDDDADDDDDEEEVSPLRLFLTETVLDAGEREGEADASAGAVQLTTIHSAKGLEFPLVFLTGMEEALFPGAMAKDDPHEVEEERRLCYVGMTRAMRELNLSWAQSRRLYGRTDDSRPSRFLREVPKEFLAMESDAQEDYGEDGGGEGDEAAPFAIGQGVAHRKFGEGVVLKIEGSGAHARAYVNFKKVGSKWLVLSYAKLKAL